MYQIEVCYSKNETNKVLFQMQKVGCNIVIVQTTSITFKDGRLGSQYTIFYQKPVTSEPKKPRQEVDYASCPENF